MTFLEILKEDHDKVKHLFSQIETGGGPKEKILTQIEEELKLHMEVEEKFLYLALEISSPIKGAPCLPLFSFN